MAHPKQLSRDFSGALRTFGFWIANGTVGNVGAGLPILEGIDYRSTILSEPSLLEAVIAIFANVIEFDANGRPINAKYAERRAAQYIRSYMDPDFDVEPPFEEFETALYSPPPRTDIKPWPAAALPKMIPAGYLAKKNLSRSDGMETGAAENAGPTGSHVSPDLLDYRNVWKRNGFGIFDTPEAIVAFAREHAIDLSAHRLFYYEVFESEFDEVSQAWRKFAPVASVTSVARPDGVRREGFDVIAASPRHLPGCSPLSCNPLLAGIQVNSHGLFNSLDDALTTLEVGLFDNGKPGPFRIFAVYSVEHSP